MNTNVNVTKLIERVVASKAETIKLGLDLHARDVVMCGQFDSAVAQRPQKMGPAQLLASDCETRRSTHIRLIILVQHSSGSI